MKIVLIFPNIYEMEKIISTSIHLPLSLGYIAAILEEEGHSVLVLDAAVDKRSIQSLLLKIQEFDPDVIGLTSNIATAFMSEITLKACKLRFPTKKFIIGGPWASANYESILIKEIADIVVMGEGEVTIKDLIIKLENKESYNAVKGIAYRTPQKRVIKNLDRELIEDLDTIPFPAWHLFPNSRKYNMVRRGRHFFPVMTSRGCPYSCIHCTKIIFGTKMRYRSIENVVAEIQMLRANFHADEILLVDDNFTLNRKRAMKLLLKIARLPFKIKIQFSNGIRADIMSTQLLSSMIHAGVYRIALGIESGNQNIVDKIGKRLSLDAVEQTASLLHKYYNFVTVGFLMLGHPFDTRKTMLDTINFAQKLDLDYVHFFKNIIFPGTEQYTLIPQLGGTIFRGAIEGVPGGYNRPFATFETPSLKVQDIEWAYKQSYKNFYLRPFKLIKTLSKIRSWHEFTWIFNYAKNTLKYLFLL